MIDIVAVTDPMRIRQARLPVFTTYNPPRRIEKAILETATAMAPPDEDYDPRLQPELLPGYFDPFMRVEETLSPL